jgi:hypothetical protein
MHLSDSSVMMPLFFYPLSSVNFNFPQKPAEIFPKYPPIKSVFATFRRAAISLWKYSQVPPGSSHRYAFELRAHKNVLATIPYFQAASILE